MSKINEEILSLTGRPEWQTFLQLLSDEYNTALKFEHEADNWGDVKFYRGYGEALAWIARLREMAKTLEESDASL